MEHLLNGSAGNVYCCGTSLTMHIVSNNEIKACVVVSCDQMSLRMEISAVVVCVESFFMNFPKRWVFKDRKLRLHECEEA